MSLRDQLFSAGIINKKELRKSKQAAKKERKKKQGSRQKKSVVQAREKEQKAAEKQAHVAKKREERLVRDQAKAEVTRRKQVDQLLAHHQIRAYRGDSPFYHLSANRRFVHKLYVKGSVSVDLERGDAAICHLGGDEPVYVIVPARVARKILEIAPDHVLLFNGIVASKKDQE